MGCGAESATGIGALYFEKEGEENPSPCWGHTESTPPARFGKGKLEELVFQRQHHTEQGSAS